MLPINSCSILPDKSSKIVTMSTPQRGQAARQGLDSKVAHHLINNLDGLLNDRTKRHEFMKNCCQPFIFEEVLHGLHFDEDGSHVPDSVK